MALIFFFAWGWKGMAQWLKALITFPEDPGTIPSTHLATHNCLELQFQEI